MSVKATTSVRNGYSVGEKQCSYFIKERLRNSDNEKLSIYATVRKNSLALVQFSSNVTVPKVKREKTALTEQIQLYSS